MTMARSLIALLCPLLALAAVACAVSSDDESGGVTGDDQNVLDRGRERGRKTIHLASPTPGAPDEICVLPNHIAGADYKGGDDKSEAELCSYVFHGAGPREADAPKVDVAICPKLSSTNPGTDVQALLPGKSREETKATICRQSDRATKLLAKYKQSITCSYAPSIVGYYHLSRALGGAGDVKPAVIRTMDLAEHKKLVGDALGILDREANDSFPKVSWLSYRSSESNPAGSRFKDAVYTTDLLQIYGGLQENARGETTYSELNRRGAEPNIAGPFTQTGAFRRVTDGRPLAQIAGRTLEASAQAVVQMSDITEMLVMDYLMSQQDRFGNIHSVDYLYFPKEGGGVDKVKKSKVDDHEIAMPAGAVAVKKMLLKDNDCGGPQKTNQTKNAGLLDQVRHMNAKTYSHLRWLAANFGPNAPIPVFFGSESLFSQADINMLRTNLGVLAPKLHDACTSGRLLLDLDLEGHLAGRGHDPASCEAAQPPKP